MTIADYEAEFMMKQAANDLVDSTVERETRVGREGFENGIFRLYGAVCEESVVDLMIDLDAYEHRFPIMDLSHHEITLRIYSQGGNYEAGMALYGHLRRLSAKGYKVITEGYGIVGSIATIIFQAGDVRRIAVGAQFMLHGISSDVTGTYFDMQNKVNWMGQKMRNMAKIYAERSGFQNRELDVLAQMQDGNNWYYSADATCLAGYADEVIGVRA